MTTQRVTILHTNDFHNHLKAEQARVLKAAKAECGPDCLLIDAGDAISAGNVGVRIAGEPILRLMTETGYDAMTCGNRETHLSDSILRYKIADAGFPLLCANLAFKNRDSGSGSKLPTCPYVIKTLGSGVKVGIVGVTVPMVTHKMAARHISDYLFDDPISTACKLADELRPEVDLLIAMTHIGIKSDRELAARAPKYDLIVTGHTHLVVNEGEEKAETVPIMQAGWFAKYYGRVDFDITPGERPRIAASQIFLLSEQAA